MESIRTKVRMTDMLVEKVVSNLVQQADNQEAEIILFTSQKCKSAPKDRFRTR